MRKFIPGTLVLVLLLLLNTTASTQDFSNRGKDFWIAYTGHIDGTTSVMGLYLTSDINTSGNVQVGSVNLPFTITANQVTRLFIGPGGNGNAPNTVVYNGQADGIRSKAGIHVTSLKNIVVYSHIIKSARSGATLVLPTPVLGKEYVIPSYQNVGSQNGQDYGYGQITVVAVQPNTTIEITPTANDRQGGHPAGRAFQVTLNNEGDVYQLQSQQDADFSGSTVKSVSNAGEGCKPIAVFSSTTWSAFDCGGASGGDNLYQQLFPTKSWGKKFITAPFFSRPYDIIRVFVTDPTTVIRKTENGVTTILTGLLANSYYEFKTSNPTTIEADKQVSVVQYITSQTCGVTNSDPEMILINPIEQTLTDITLFSAHQNYVPNGQTQVTTHFINIVIPTTYKNTLRIDGKLPNGTFVDIAGEGYSYLQENVTSSSAVNPVHNVVADTGFTAIVYGYGNVESYGYNAGTNLRDLYQFVSVNNQYATVDFPAACKGAPFTLSMTFPYQPTEIKWEFNGIFPDVTLPNPVFTSSSTVNGRQLYKYVLAGSYIAPAIAGTYPIRMTAQNPTADGCNGEQEIDYDLEVFDAPDAAFNFTTNGCVSAPVAFTDASVNNSGRPISHRHWNFGDASVANDVTTTSHTYAAAGSYDVKYTLITDVGCKADTVVHSVVLNDPPVARFTIAAPDCAGKSIAFTDGSTTPAGSTINKWIWNFGDGSAIVNATTNAAQTHTFANTGTFTVTLQVVSGTGCLSTVFSQPITIHPNPVVSFNLPDVCLPAGTAAFTSSSSIADGTESQFTYSWNFGDATATATGQSTTHNYTAQGPYNVALTVTSNNGCATTGTQSLTTIYAEPKAVFTSVPEVCLGNTVNFTNQSTAAGSTVTQWEWDLGDGTSTDPNPVHTYAVAGTYIVTLSVTSAIGCRTVTNTATHNVVVNPLPTAGFNVSIPGCTDDNVTLTSTALANAGNIVKWEWDYSDGNTVIATTAAPVVHHFALVDTYPVTLKVTTDKGCVSTLFSKDVIIHPSPVANFLAPEVCVNDLAPFVDASSVSPGTIAGWEWNFGDPNATAGNPNTATTAQATHHYTLPGEYTAELVSITNDGCRNTISRTFTVNGAVLTPMFSVQNTTALCSNKELILKDASQVDAGHILRVEIFWDAADATIKTVDDSPAAGKLYTHTYPEFSSPATKTYTVRYDVYSGLTCVNSKTQNITLLAAPAIALDAVLPICSNEDAFQLGTQLLAPAPGNGVFSGAGVNPAGLFTPSIAGGGTHQITYTYMADNGCSNAVVKTITVYPTPVADAGPDKFVLEGGRIELTPTIIRNIQVNYSWSPALGLTNPVIANPFASPVTDSYYTLTVTSDKGCHTEDVVFVKLLKTPVIPNIFSPNGDGIHDTWVIDYLDSYPGCIVQIFNRYGQLVYRAVNYTTPWDGRISGRDAPVGTYYYIIDPKNGRKPITGFIDIIR